MLLGCLVRLTVKFGCPLLPTSSPTRHLRAAPAHKNQLFLEPHCLLLPKHRDSTVDRRKKNSTIVNHWPFPLPWAGTETFFISKKGLTSPQSCSTSLLVLRPSKTFFASTPPNSTVRTTETTDTNRKRVLFLHIVIADQFINRSDPEATHPVRPLAAHWKPRWKSSGLNEEGGACAALSRRAARVIWRRRMEARVVVPSQIKERRAIWKYR